MATRVQRVTISNTDVGSLAITPTSTPVSGNLLVIGHYASGTDQTTMAGPAGWTSVTGAAATATAAGATRIYYKVSNGTETGPYTVTNVNVAGVFAGAIFEEWSAGGVSFAGSPVDASGFTNGAGGGTTTITVAATGATTQANTLAFALVGTSATVTAWGNTWTGGFAQDTTITTRMELAVKQTTATETLSTTETWTTSRVARASLAAFKLPSALPVPTGLTATPVSSDRIALSWTAASGATGYDIERNGAVVASSVVTTSYEDTGLTAATAYSYRVRSVG